MHISFSSSLTSHPFLQLGAAQTTVDVSYHRIVLIRLTICLLRFNSCERSHLLILCNFGNRVGFVDFAFIFGEGMFMVVRAVTLVRNGVGFVYEVIDSM